MHRQIIVDIYRMYGGTEKRNWLGIFSIRNNYTETRTYMNVCLFLIYRQPGNAVKLIVHTQHALQWDKMIITTSHMQYRYANTNWKSQINKCGVILYNFIILYTIYTHLKSI